MSKSYYKSFITLLSGNVISQFIPFIAVPILTRIYSKEDFAIFANYTAIVAMIGIVASGRLDLAIPIAKDKKEAQDIVFTGLVLVLLLTLLSFIFPIFSNFFALIYQSKELADYLFLIPIGVLFYGFLGLTNNWMLRFKKYNVISIGKVVQAFSNNGLAVLLGLIGWGTWGLIYGWISGFLFGILIMLYYVDKALKLREHVRLVTIKTTIKKYKDFPLINSLHAFTDIFATQTVLFWLVTTYYGLEQLGLFAIMYKYVRAPIGLVTSSVSNIFYTEMSSAINNGESPIPILKKTIKTTTAFSIPFILILLLFGPVVFSWYLGESWREAGVYSQMIAPVLFMMFIVSPISGIPIILNQQKKAYVFAVIGYIFTLSTLFIIGMMGFSFKTALLYYSMVFALYQVSYLYWLYRLIKNRNTDTISIID